MGLKPENSSETLTQAMKRVGGGVDDVLADVLPKSDSEDGFEPESQLFDAMRYAVLGGGKRLRPFLVAASAELFDVPEAVFLRVGAAVELVHDYSLIHDDLPCMDDDPIRRGKPSCHVQFGESTAVLAGDALMPLAFELLADPLTHPDPVVRGELIAGLAMAAGAKGMVGGQMIDLATEGQTLDIGEITHLERLKTGALIGFCCDAGAILGRAQDKEHRALAGFSHDLGLAYQIADDLLDVVGNVETVGKAVGKDAARGKATFISILGVEKARAQALLLADQAANHLDCFGGRGRHLRELARYVVERSL
jgi:farnesyl diphosphate synthase